MRFTQIQPNAFEKIQINAGVIMKEFLKYGEDGKLTVPDSSKMDAKNIIGVTSGGIAFAPNPEYVDFGEDMDNVPANTWQLKRLSGYSPTLSGTFVTIDNELGRTLVGAYNENDKYINSDANTKGAASGDEGTVHAYKIEPISDLKKAFQNLWFVGDYTTQNGAENGGFVAIHLKNALSTGGFQWQSGKDAKGQFAFEFTGHYDLDHIEDIPFCIYMREPDTEKEEESE